MTIGPPRFLCVWSGAEHLANFAELPLNLTANCLGITAVAQTSVSGSRAGFGFHFSGNLLGAAFGSVLGNSFHARVSHPGAASAVIVVPGEWNGRLAVREAML